MTGNVLIIHGAPCLLADFNGCFLTFRPVKKFKLEFKPQGD